MHIYIYERLVICVGNNLFIESIRNLIQSNYKNIRNELKAHIYFISLKEAYKWI